LARDFEQESEFVEQVVNITNSIQQSLTGAQRVFEVLDAREEVTSPRNPVLMPRARGAVRFERLAPGSVPADVRRQLRRSAPWLMRRVVARLKPEGAQQLYRRSLDVRIMWVASWAGLLALLRRALRARPRGVIRTQLRRLRLLVRGKLSIRARR